MKSQQSLKLRIFDYVFTFFEMPLQKKRKKSRFLDFQKKTYSRTMFTSRPKSKSESQNLKKNPTKLVSEFI